jgi:uncharacterized membrane-anchored protein YhcB (DUF1043 family)
MTTASGLESGDGRFFAAYVDQTDDASDITPNDDRNARVKERKRDEKTLRFRFKQSNLTTNDINPRTIHLHWMAAIQEEFGDKVRIIDNNNRVIPKVDLLRWTPLQHQQHYKIHKQTPNDSTNAQETVRFNSPNRRKAQFIIHRIQTTISLREIKAIPKIRQLLVDNSCYLHEHRWSEHIWNTTHLGFMVGINPQYYDVDQATIKINSEIHKKFPRTKVPQFRLVFTAPQIRTEQFHATTKAYAIETERGDSLTMMQILKTTYQESAAFTPFQLRSKSPEAYARTIHQQSRILASHHVIILQNIDPDAMFYLVDHIQALIGVLDVIPSKTISINGNYRVLVDKDHFRNLRRTLLKNLPLWYSVHVPLEARPREGQYPDDPMVAPLHEDGYSSGDGLYMAKSIATAFSYEGSVPSFADDTNRTDNPDTLQRGSPPSVQGKETGTWADRVRQNQKNDLADFASIPHPSLQNEVDLISDLASSKAEVAELKTQITELTKSFETQRSELLEFFKEEMTRSLAEQLQTFAKQQQQVPQHQETTTIGQVVELIQSQDRKFQALTDMVASMMTLANTTTVKRTPEAFYESDKAASPTRQPTEKRIDRKTTPSKHLFYSDTDCDQQSPPQTDHKEMDLSGESLTPGGTQASSHAAGVKGSSNQYHD